MNINGVWQWIKWGVVLGLVVMVWFYQHQLTGAQAQNQQLATQLDQVISDNQSNVEALNLLQKANQQANNMLIQRQQHAIETERQLNEEMAVLKTQLDNVQCAISAAVTERLRQPY